MKNQNLLYLQMRAYLLDIIERQQHTPHYRLPSENQLSCGNCPEAMSTK